MTGLSGILGGTDGTVRVGIIGGGRPPPVRPGGGGGPRPGGTDGALRTPAGGPGGGGCLLGGGTLRRGPPPGEEGAPLTEVFGPVLLGGGIQSDFTGGGAGTLTVAMETSPMIFMASLHAWYCLSISSRLIASSALSSIIF